MIPIFTDRKGLGNVEIQPITVNGEPPVNSNGALSAFDDEGEFIQYSVLPDQLSYLNTPVFSDLLLMHNNRELHLDTVIFDVTQSKHIVKTKPHGRTGTFKEYVRTGDFFITIQALITSKSKNYPEDQVRNFKEMMQINESLECVSPLLQLFGIDNLVVESFKLPNTNGFTNMQKVEISAISDFPIEIIYDGNINI